MRAQIARAACEAQSECVRYCSSGSFVDRSGKFAERCEALRIAQVDLEFSVERLLVTVLPRTAFL